MLVCFYPRFPLPFQIWTNPTAWHTYARSWTHVLLLKLKPSMDPTISGNDGHGEAANNAKKGFFRRAGRGLVNVLCSCVRRKSAT